METHTLSFAQIKGEGVASIHRGTTNFADIDHRTVRLLTVGRGLRHGETSRACSNHKLKSAREKVKVGCQFARRLVVGAASPDNRGRYLAEPLLPMSVQSYPWQHIDRSTYPDMNYLLSEGARARYVLAAHYVRNQRQVVEIGGFKTPITAFLTRVPEQVLVVDPLVQAYQADELYGNPCRVEHIATTFQEHPFHLHSGAYGLVLLGASMKHFSQDSTLRQSEADKLVGLVSHAAVAVLEFALEWELGKDNITAILDNIGFEIILQMDIDLSQSPGMNTAHHRRRLMVLKPFADFPEDG
jgi:hypothetical protein